MSRFGIDFLPVFWGFMAAFAESIGAVLIVLGILFMPMSLILAITMFVGWIGHVISGEGNPGHSFKNMMVLIAFALTGPGKYSVDAWLAAKKEQANG